MAKNHIKVGILLLLCLLAGQARGAEFAVNGNLETWSSATDAGTWTETISGSSSVNREASEQYSGSYAARIDVDGSGSIAYITNRVTLSTTNEHYFRFYHKETGSSQVKYNIQCKQAGDYYNFYLQSNGTWSASSAEFNLAHADNYTLSSKTFTPPVAGSYDFSILRVAGANSYNQSHYIDAVSIGLNAAANVYVRQGGTALTRAAASGPGSDASACLSASNLQYDTLIPGDIIYFADDGGIIRGQALLPASSGTAENNITITSESGDTPILIQGPDLSGTWTDRGGGIYSIAYTGTPNTVYDTRSLGSVLTANDGNFATLSAGQWDLESGELYVRLSDDADPSGDNTVEAPNATATMLLNTVDYYDISNLSFKYCSYSSVGCLSTNGASNLNISNITTDWGYHGVVAVDGSDVVISRVNSTNNYSSAVAVAAQSALTLTGNIIEYCTVSTSGKINEAIGVHGVELGATDGIVDGAIIRYNNLTGGTGYTHGIQSRTYATKTKVYRNSLTGFSPANQSAIAFAVGDDESVIYGNHITDSYFALTCTNCVGSKIFSNVIRNTESSTIMQRGINIVGGSPVIANNTIYKIVVAGVALNTSATVPAALNNLIHTAGYGFRTYDAGSSITSLTNNSFYTITLNYYYYLNGSNTALPGETNITSNPQLRSPTTGDLRLDPGSPAIDAGICTANPACTSGSYRMTAGYADAAGNNKWYGDGVDIGAYERKKFLFDDDMIPRFYKAP